MKGSEHRLDKCMDLCRRGLLWSSFVAVLVLLSFGAGAVGQASDNPAFVFFDRPPDVTANTTAMFRWGVVEPNGTDPCAIQDCVNQCKIADDPFATEVRNGNLSLDNAPFQNCSSRYAVYANLTDGVHIFTVLVSTVRGHFVTNDTSWTVDTISPTAKLSAGSPFTNAYNITLDVKFTEPCIPRNGAPLCANLSSCFVFANGPASVIPSTFAVITPGLEYSLVVSLSAVDISGRVVLGMRPRDVCYDGADNPFVRSSTTFFNLRFDRSVPTVNVWTPALDSQVQINNAYKTISATNSSANLLLYVDFSQAMVTSAEELGSAIQISQGTLVPGSRKKKYSNFAFEISNVSDFAILSITVPANSSFNRFGTGVAETKSLTFLYDSVRPQVTLSTTSLAKTKSHLIPFLIQFTEPVFVFEAINVTISGGNLTSFVEVSKSTYTFELYIADDDAITVGIDENVTYDIAGNPNLPSNILRIRHYTEPAFAVGLYSFTTAGLIATAVASGALSISSATLAAAGALNSRMSGSITSEPSRNLLGMATHLQVFALSDWLAVSLPVEYRETTRGLRWLIPHVNTPWQHDRSSDSIDNPLLQQLVEPSTPTMKSIIHARRRLLNDDCRGYSYRDFIPNDLGQQYKSRQRRPRCFHECRQPELDRISNPTNMSSFRASLAECQEHVMPELEAQGPVSSVHGVHYRARRRLGRNMTVYGPALSANEYVLYFQNDLSNIEFRNMFDQTNYTGWRDFERNMFWVGVVGGGMILLHLLLLLLLRWRTKTSVRGALTIPRFELLLLIFFIPAMCQASAFVIRGRTTLGIIIGVLLLAIPAAFFLSVVLFLVIAIFMGSLVQYTEVVEPPSEDEGRSLGSRLLVALAGPNSLAKWVRKDGLAPTFLPRFGLFFEDRKGPPKFILLEEIGGSFPKWVDSGSNGVGRMRAVNSDDESDEVEVPILQKILGGARAAYILVEISRRIALGVIFGAFPRSDESWIQVSIALGFTVAQLIFLFLLKPFLKRGVQVVETISLLCETGLFVTALVLLKLGHPSNDHMALGSLMIALLLLTFVSQLVNEWYALMKQLLRLSPDEEPSLKEGLKMLSRGLFLPFVPRRHWGRFITPQPAHPRTGLVPVVHISPDRAELEQIELERARRSTSVHTGSPLIALGPEPAVPGYDPGSPAFVDPRNAVTDEAVISGEIKPDITAVAASAQRLHNGKPNTNWGSQWNRSRSMEGKRSMRGAKDPKSSEMKMLRDIAKASFPRWRKREEEESDPGMDISSPVLSNVGMGAVARKHSSSAPSRVGDEQVFSEDSGSDNSSDDERYRRRPQLVGESSIDVLGGPSRGITPHSSSSFEKGSKGSGPLETTLSGGSLPIRELVQER